LGSARAGHWEGREDVRIAGLAKGRAIASKVISEKAAEAYADLTPAMSEWRDSGETLQAIADKLNEEGHTTRRGKQWNAVQVMRVLERVS